jgi:hypothetical protein
MTFFYNKILLITENDILRTTGQKKEGFSSHLSFYIEYIDSKWNTRRDK